jgi:hypothetical protein
LLEICCGVAETELGSIDFTGCFFPEEPCQVFRPCLALAIDDAGRRWIAELGDKSLPGPIWCMFPDPKVAVYVSDDLAAFMATLHGSACRGETRQWLQELSNEARMVWTQRHALARRPYQLHDSDEKVRRWLAGLPFDAYVYDLRSPKIARGWPYGLAGPSARLYRCARLPVFAVVGSPSDGWRQKFSATIPPTHPKATACADGVDLAARCKPSTRRSLPANPLQRPARGTSDG